MKENPKKSGHGIYTEKTVGNRAKPNQAHEALIDLEKGLNVKFLLITQNVDGLHLRAGQSKEKTYQIHGKINYTRCSEDCWIGLQEVAKGIKEKNKEDKITNEEWEMLKCPDCGELLRPHVLWVDEYYNESWYKFNSSLEVAVQADLLIVVGTSGATNLPM